MTARAGLGFLLLAGRWAVCSRPRCRTSGSRNLSYIGLFTIVAWAWCCWTGVGGADLLSGPGRPSSVASGRTTATSGSVHGHLALAGVVRGHHHRRRGLVRALLTLRMSGTTAAHKTIAWALALYTPFSATSGSGQPGITSIGHPAVHRRAVTRRRVSLPPHLGCAVLIAAAGSLLDSRPGRAIRAPLALMRAMGYSFLARSRSSSSPLLAAFPGWLYAHFQRFVSPRPRQGIEYLFMAVVGGVGHVWGPSRVATVIKLLEDGSGDWLPLHRQSGSY